MNISRRRFFTRSAAGAAAALALSRGALAAEPWPALPEAPAGPIQLDSNENPYGPFPSARKVMEEALNAVNRYPDRGFDDLLGALSARHDCTREELLLGAGSNDCLRMAAEAFCGKGQPLVVPAPTFGAIAGYARRYDAPVEAVPLRADFAHDLEKMLAFTGLAPGLVYICNPNNPTATLTPRAEIEAFLKKVPARTMVVIDEAYHEFAVGAEGYQSFAERRLDDPRVVVTRTFSKIYGMAGLRVGYAIGTKEAIARMRGYSIFDNQNAVGARAAAASLLDNEALAAAVKRNAADRRMFQDQARGRNVAALPSHANFVMLDTGRPVRDVIAHFRTRHILVGRPFPPLETHVRLSLGTPEEMRAFWKAWDEMA